MKQYKYPVVLTIAGSDSGGGAGIQADLKTFSALGCFGTSAITAITVQNTLGVTAIHSIPVDIVKGQIKAVIDDLKPQAIKIGMVHSAELAKGIAEILLKEPSIPVVLDPVMISTSGHKLIEDETVDVLTSHLFPLATVITPNLDEAAVLTGVKLDNVDDMQKAAIKLLETGCRSVLVKGGHLKSKVLYDVFVDANGNELVFEGEFIQSNNVHGTGCTLSSAIGAYLARGERLNVAISLARDYIKEVIEAGKDVRTGEGNGPLNHFFNPQKLIKYEIL
ncbi:bifunctional hydroxymethylpyrimidine kinase/phosphomethylpyrimidine kinase [Solitalea canadensis]|uniref:hydroxymethylpyrimidine kinase n=1 Tax=Solitalea canadensis (strain ATCC 29591 / DSM 3403 / JCM 21819 / LMG 8368 / NBRC 15130 / NCIMB 12057 / USAM 9D) TaxID=929556 RepID=H8KKZ3_SOLCM|nr:bifunctional hydroxymethylpyrimidine kinase/phosphomethylpyrimidine kinase [Solitalea canadensis]AFD08810.1 phosphomethylpyrimidine kinase [Solitalea canadensis DSM 3403]